VLYKGESVVIFGSDGRRIRGWRREELGNCRWVDGTVMKSFCVLAKRQYAAMEGAGPLVVSGLAPSDATSDAMLCCSLTREAIPEGLSAAQCRVDAQLSQACGQLVPFCSAQGHVECGEGELERAPAVNVPELRGLASVAPSVLGLCARSPLLSAPATRPPAQAKASRPRTRTAAGNTVIAPSSLFDQPSVC
jgi:hypothetical protein